MQLFLYPLLDFVLFCLANIADWNLAHDNSEHIRARNNRQQKLLSSGPAKQNPVFRVLATAFGSRKALQIEGGLQQPSPC